jgi:hypothetical protein
MPVTQQPPLLQALAAQQAWPVPPQAGPAPAVPVAPADPAVVPAAPVAPADPAVVPGLGATGLLLPQPTARASKVAHERYDRVESQDVRVIL